MKEKLFALSLSIMLIFSFAACGNGTSDNSESSDTEKASNSATKASEEVTEPDETVSVSENTEMDEFLISASIEETVLYDENNVIITATDIEYSNYEVTLNILIENNSDEDLKFISGSAGYSCNSVNGYMCSSGYLYENVSAGMKANEDIDFSITELQLFGINEVADICIAIEIEDDEYNAIYTGPMQVLTTAADTYDYETDTFLNVVNSGVFETIYECTVDYFTTDVAVNSEDVQILSEGVMTNTDNETLLWLEVENNTDEVIYAVTSNVFINGLYAYSGTWYSDAIVPGGRSVMTMEFEYLSVIAYRDTIGIDAIGNVAFTFSVRDEDQNSLFDGEELSIIISDAVLDTTGTEIYSDEYVTLVSKGLVEDTYSNSDDIHLLILAKNNTDRDVYLRDEYDSLSVNGFMTDYSYYGATIPVGAYALLDVELDYDSLTENDIDSIEDIVEISFSTKIYDSDYSAYEEVYIPKLTIEF
ncbi:MAG: catabolite control protein A [Lachnospiraceae bacterium]|nr:catabolite control protein A [Lachnospiraceae bacterium]